MQKLFIFLECFEPNQTSTSILVTSIAKFAIKSFSGSVVVVCATQKDENIFENTGCKIIRIPSGNWNKNNLLQRVIKFSIITMRFSWFALMRIRRNDIALFVTNPAFMILFAAFLRRLRKFHFLLLAYDIFPENLIAAKILKKENLFYHLSKSVFDWAYACADHVISIGRDMNTVLEKKGVEPCRIVCIPNWCDTSKIIPETKEENPLVQKYMLADKIVFLFAGNIGRVQGIDNLLKAISMTSASDVAFLFVGNGAKEKDVREFAAKYPEKNVVVTGGMSVSQQQIFLNACDVAVVTLGEHMYGLGVPSKSYYNMAAGKPLLYIGEKNTEIALVIDENGIGWQVNPEDPGKLSTLINSIASIPREELLKMGKKARSIVEQKFSEEASFMKYKHLFTKLFD